MAIGLLPVKKHAQVVSFNNSEIQLEFTKASNQLDFDLSNSNWLITR
jgi:hypothetical protein